VVDPSKHGSVTGGACDSATPNACAYTWLDPVSAEATKGSLGIPKYDFFFALQDRMFLDDGSFQFADGAGMGNLTPGNNPTVHPVWVPEYFGDHMLVNGVLWPKKTVAPGWYRIRMADGSDSRCYTVGFQNAVAPLAPAEAPVNNVPFYVIGGDQGYLSQPRLTTEYTFCPGERVDLLVNFHDLPLGAPGSGGQVYMTNSAAAPYPSGTPPTAIGGGFEDMNIVMRFDVNPLISGVQTCTAPGDFTWPPVTGNGCLLDPAAGFGLQGTDPVFAASSLRSLVFDGGGALAPVMCAPGTIGNCITAIRQLYLNERADGFTDSPLGMQINGVPFEYKVTETPRKGAIELWKIINLTVDAHPMHPHLVKHQRVAVQRLDVGAYKTALCGSATCQPGTSPGGEMQLVPNVEAANQLGQVGVIGAPIPVGTADLSGGMKDASIVLPGYITWFIAKWDGPWASTSVALATAPGTVHGSSALVGANIDNCFTLPGDANVTPACQAANFVYEDVTTGPFVWHCHINSHEDSEMMRTSLVVP